MKILTVEQMREVDRLSTELHGVPGLLLMENAGSQLYRALENHFGEQLSRRSIALFCGKGNNGGDGLVLARQLAMRGFAPHVYLLARSSGVKGDAAVNLEIWTKSGGRFQEVDPESWPEVEERVGSYDLIVDALLGTGLDKPLEGLYARAVAAINRSQAFVLAVDIPTGMFSDSVRQSGEIVQADLTVTFTAPNIAHILHHQQEALGRLEVVPIGSPPTLLDRPDFFLRLMQQDEVAEYRLPRLASSHKGTYGHLLVVAGSRGKSGAAVLASTAALLSGAGLVTACVPDGIRTEVAAHRPELMTEGLTETSRGTLAREALSPLRALSKDKDAVALGPGLGTASETNQLVRRLVDELEAPLVVDADGINAFAGRAKDLRSASGQPIVATPHPGEFSRLSGLSTSEIVSEPVRVARQFSLDHGVWLVLKGFRTLVATPRGQVHACPLGNPGMATAGMGDVLTGVLTAMLGFCRASGRSGDDDISRAVILGVYLHSLAGDLAGQLEGFEALTAASVLESISEAYAALESR